jgi:short-subunit dehydrogenase
MEDLSKLGVTVVVFDIQEPTFALRESIHNPLLSSKPSLNRAASNVAFYKVDITSPSAVKDAATLVRKDHGNPTILINNAGVAFISTILNQPEAEIRLCYDVNTISHYWTVKELLPDMLEKDHGHIVTIASTASFAGAGAMADYSGSKASALAFHESLTQEVRHWYGAKRVRTR